MKKEQSAAQTLHGYLLSEGQHERLQQIRDHLYLLADFVLVTSEAEDDELQISRSRLGSLFDTVGFQLDHLLQGVQWIKQSAQAAVKHR